MGRKKLDKEVVIGYFGIRINSQQYPLLIDFLNNEENVNQLICVLLINSERFKRFTETVQKSEDSEKDNYCFGFSDGLDVEEKNDYFYSDFSIF